MEFLHLTFDWLIGKQLYRGRLTIHSLTSIQAFFIMQRMGNEMCKCGEWGGRRDYFSSVSQGNFTEVFSFLRSGWKAGAKGVTGNGASGRKVLMYIGEVFRKPSWKGGIRPALWALESKPQTFMCSWITGVLLKFKIWLSRPKEYRWCPWYWFH